MRITQKYLLRWLRDEFKRLNIDLEIYMLYKTRYTSDQYNAGAAYFVYKVGKDGKWLQRVYIFYPIGYLQKALHNGYELYFRNLGQYIAESEVDLRPISEIS